MDITPKTQAILLLTSHFNRSVGCDVKPFTPAEWGRFASWLREHDLAPEDLYNIDQQLNGWGDKAITRERIEQLMGRGAALALAMEKWSRTGLWVLTRSDPDYPARLKQRLGNRSPAVLYGCGNKRLLNSGGIAVIGARDAGDDDLGDAKRLAARAAKQGFSIISGGARGVDETSMSAALDAEGTVIGVMANSLLRASTSSRYRPHLLNNNLVLISPLYPEAGFNAGNAMARNKHIYCLSDAAIIIQSGRQGGTWNGAMENLKKSWVPLWVKTTNRKDSGNSELVRKGGRWLPNLLDTIQFSRFSDPVKHEWGETDQTSNVSRQISFSFGATQNVKDSS